METKIISNSADGGSNPLSHDRLLTVEEVAKFLRLSSESVYRHFRAGRIQGVRLGRTIRFAPVEIARFFAQADGGLW